MMGCGKGFLAIAALLCGLAIEGRAQSPPDSMAILSGIVASALTGTPLRDAHVALTASGLGAITDERGAFRITGIPPGKETVTVGLIGFARDSAPLTFRAGQTTDVVFLLSETVLRLEEITVSVTPAADPGKLADFHRRKAHGQGYFIGPGEIEKQNVEAASDLLRGVPGVDVAVNHLGTAEVRMTRSGRDCRPQYWVDGVWVAGFNIDEVQPGDILAIEVFRGAAETPLQFQARHSEGCATIVVWTKEGRPR